MTMKMNGLALAFMASLWVTSAAVQTPVGADEEASLLQIKNGVHSKLNTTKDTPIGFVRLGDFGGCGNTDGKLHAFCSCSNKDVEFCKGICSTDSGCLGYSGSYSNCNMYYRSSSSCPDECGGPGSMFNERNRGKLTTFPGRGYGGCFVKVTQKGCYDKDGNGKNMFGHREHGAKDTSGHICDEYQKDWCGKFDDDDFKSADMCCTCGGGGQESGWTKMTQELYQMSEGSEDFSKDPISCGSLKTMTNQWDLPDQPIQGTQHECVQKCYDNPACVAVSIQWTGLPDFTRDCYLKSHWDEGAGVYSTGWMSMILKADCKQ